MSQYDAWKTTPPDELTPEDGLYDYDIPPEPEMSPEALEKMFDALRAQMKTGDVL